jgi:putative endonuclease
MWKVYILYSASRDRYYIGFTGDTLEQRIRRHNSNHKGFTGCTNDWEVVYTEIYDMKGDATNREKVLKGWKNRKALEDLIDKANSR